LELGLQKQIDMKKEILSELKLMKKLMIYSSDKTDSENIKIFEQIIGEPPADSGSGTGTGTGTGTGSGNRQSAPAVQIPSELANAEGVKKFQDWLDANKAGWASGYADGKVNKGRGYGRFGPRTSKAWSQYKTEYTTNPNSIDPSLIPDLQGTTNVEPSAVEITVDNTPAITEPSGVDANVTVQTDNIKPQNTGDITVDI